MAIRIIEGKIGSGKSYFAVNHIVKNYYTWHTEALSWVSKDFDGRTVEIYSNLEGFTLGHDLTEAIKEAGGLARFFNVDYQKQFVGRRKIIYVIDEAQGPQFFHRKFYNPDVFFFFQYHRHLGIDIYLLTQDIWSLTRELRELPEFVVRVVPRVKSLMGEFKYQFMLGDEVYKTVSLRPSKNIFALYKSQVQNEVEKVGSATRRFAYIFVLLVVSAFLLFYYGFLNIFGTPKKVVASSVPASVSVLASVPAPASGSVPVPVSMPALMPASVPAPVLAPILTDIEITGIVWYSHTEGLIMFSDGKREFKMSVFEFDRLCKCSTVNRIKAGYSLSVELPNGIISQKLSSPPQYQQTTSF